MATMWSYWTRWERQAFKEAQLIEMSGLKEVRVTTALLARVERQVRERLRKFLRRPELRVICKA